ncbi:MAG: NAD(P) transhydrogenase subunit alpha [Verrucomicrobiota bacterium]
MKFFFPKELEPETRVAAVPALLGKLKALEAEVVVQAGAGQAAGLPDALYEKAGASLSRDDAPLAEADFIGVVQPPPADWIRRLKKEAIVAGFLDPFSGRERLQAWAEAGVTALSLELLPRTTLAQKMDVISSQANLAGYNAVLAAAWHSNGALPMMMTPAGTLSPSKVLIVGVGVAGLQAIATAKRLGARVEAFDTRPEVEEQVQSLGAKFLKIDLGETGGTDQGYAKELTPAQLDLQRQGLAKACAQADIVITTAKLFGRKAPIIVTAEMVAGMKAGSVIVDLAAGTGGNVEGTVADRDLTTENGVLLIGESFLERGVPRHASQVYASNLVNLIEHFWDAESKSIPIHRDDEILKGCLLAHQGAIVHERFATA